jgi:hypothetical protein
MVLSARFALPTVHRKCQVQFNPGTGVQIEWFCIVTTLLSTLPNDEEYE